MVKYEHEIGLTKGSVVEKEVAGNPIFEYIKYLIYPKFGKFVLTRPEKYGGNVTYDSYDNLVKDYVEGNIHPGDLKPSTAAHINEMIEPVRQHFINDPEAKKILELVRSYTITR